MKVFLLSVLLAAAHLSAHGEEIRRISLDGAPGLPAPAQTEGKDGIARIAKIDQPALELFSTASKPSRGTVLVFPGGGYNILAITHEGRSIARMLNEAGWDAAVLLYHVSAGPKTRELALEDATKALDLVQKRGAEFGLSAERIGVLGFSAGGHLAARLSHESAKTKGPNFLVLIYPAYLEKEGQVVEDVAPAPIPSFVFVAADDKHASGSAVFAAACRAKGIRVDEHRTESGGHGFGLKSELPEAVRDWPAKLRKFLDTL